MSMPLSRLTLGTVQFGMRYGIVNDAGSPSDAELKRIFEVAAAGGMDCIDTARAYGNAEQRLGALIQRKSRWHVTTKVAPLRDFMTANGIKDVGAAVSESVRQSLEALKVEHIDVVMFHRPDDVAEGLEALHGECDAGRVGAIGVSVYTPEQALACLQDPRIRHLQIPFNVLDYRWRQKEFVGAILARPETVVHARSAFLQGLLLVPASRWPGWVTNAEAIVAEIDRAAEKAGCLSRLELCLRYNASFPWILTTVVGVDSAMQLEQIVAAAAEGPLDGESLSQLAAVAEMASPRLIDPSSW